MRDASVGNKRVAFLGHYVPDYRRTQALRGAVHAANVDLVELHDGSPSIIRRWTSLFRMLRKERPDLIVVPFPGASDVPLAAAWRLVHGTPVVFDCYVSLYDSSIRDRHRFRPWSRQGLALWLLDAAACRLSNVNLIDTMTHADYIEKLIRLPPGKFYVVPVGYGVELEANGAAGSQQQSPDVFFYGSYVPLQGTTVIAEALRQLEEAGDQLTSVLVGNGQTRAATEAVLAGMKKPPTLIDELPPSELYERMKRGGISLGIFGSSAKASNVVPNKVFDAAALGLPIITADTPAVREYFRPGKDLIVVPPADPASLAAAIRGLHADGDLRARLGRSARRRVVEVAGPDVIARRLALAIARARTGG
jgi:glycosyltransferase involved in cell wall biosynthesis